ncbi:MATH domain and coiled-coil domain-containing At3g58360-like isoform X1 [Olea europaea subsp. europaea]|uniref:MATH domain and coiled-coil domain-containing At3g58360-like isoform X1 n=1 Tax=Olea europaea subsp. europaea TaxID=158383 RepID=A0A8S0SJQ4_OLEEU|nr:MATH domain and coiled-coil domain-containing At3g58360-like isoform X1 [Olea europaea subsp. europaea]
MEVKEKKIEVVAENKPLKDYERARCTWAIGKFTTLNVLKYDSNPFKINGYTWRLLLFPKGNRVEYLSVYLGVPDSDSLPEGWTRTAKYSIELINQMDSTKTIKKEIIHQFSAQESYCGFTSFFPLNKLHERNSGYLVNGGCEIEVEIHVIHASPVSSDKPSDSSVPDDRSVGNPVDLDVVESIYSNAKSFLMSVSKESTSVVSDATCVVHSTKDNCARLAKERFNEMISLPLDDFVNPEHETLMVETLSKLGDHLNLFSDEQAKEIMKLKAVFPTSIQEWRDSVQVKVSCQRFLSTFEKTKNLLEGSVKTEEGIKTKLEQLKIREQELKAQLEALQNDSQRLVKERLEVSKQTQKIHALAEEQSGKVKGKEIEIAGAENKLEDLKSIWASIKSLFTEA